MFTLNQTFTINIYMCYTLQSKVIFFLGFSRFCLFLSHTRTHTVCVRLIIIFFVFFTFLFISRFFSSIYAKLKASLFVLCCVFSFFSLFILLPILNFILLCAFVAILYYTFLYTPHFVCILCVSAVHLICYTLELSQTLRFLFRFFPTFFIIYS